MRRKNLFEKFEHVEWLRVDRLLGELGLPKDSKAGREQLEQHLEKRRAHEEGDEFKAIRRGWCLGDETFRKELLEHARTRATENHHAQPRRETVEDKADRLLTEELEGLGWERSELARRPKGDARKVRIAEVFAMGA